MRAYGPAAAALLLAAGCVPEPRLSPTQGAQVLQGDTEAATASSSGVELVADGHAWNGSPSNLERSLTPVFVRLENRSGRPLRIRYGDFALIGGESRFRYAALPPLSLNDGGALSSSDDSASEQGTGGAGRAAWHLSHPPLSWRAYGYRHGWGWGWSYGYGPWSGPYVGPYYNPYYPGPYYTYQCEEPLPTEDMLSKALPEGTLEDGGLIQGFLYFPSVDEREDRVVLQARLVDARSGEQVGTLDIPFQVRKG